MNVRHAIYLHGFASSARSSKATWFVRRAREAGLTAECPDLNQPEFSSLTISRMVDEAASLCGRAPDGPVALVGSSLGAVVALHAAARQAASSSPRSVTRLVFLAPAFDLLASLDAHYGPAALADWRRSDALPVFHYGDQSMRHLGWSFYEDARQYDAHGIHLDTPTLIFQGTRDEAVDPEMVQRWASTRPSVTLRLLDDDHQLLASLDTMWSGIREFLDLPR